MKILLGLDTSPHAEHTLDFVCRMAWPERTSVKVVSVVESREPHVAPSPSLLASVAQNLAVIEERQVEVHERLLERAARHLETAGLAVTTELQHGDARHVLADAARCGHVDLVVVGSRGAGGLGRGPGTVAAHVLGHAPCSVIVVR